MRSQMILLGCFVGLALAHKHDSVQNLKEAFKAWRSSLTVMFLTPRRMTRSLLLLMMRERSQILLSRDSGAVMKRMVKKRNLTVQEGSARLIRKTSATHFARIRMLENFSASLLALSSAVTWSPALTEVCRLSGVLLAWHSTWASRPASGERWLRTATSRPGPSSPSLFSTRRNQFVSLESWHVEMASACLGLCFVTILWTVLTAVMRICVTAEMIPTGRMTVTLGSAACPSATVQ